MRYAYKPEITPDLEKDWVRKTWDGTRRVLCYEDEDVLQLTHIFQQAELIWKLDWEAQGEKSKADDQPEFTFFVWAILPGADKAFQRQVISAPAPTATETSSLGCQEFCLHYHHERNHQGLGNDLIEEEDAIGRREGEIRCRERLGGLLRYYYREVA